MVTGWGQNSTDPKVAGPLGELQEADLNTIPNSQCKKFNKELPYVITDNMICGVNPKEGICYGDSGSPMITLSKNGTYQQIGIASFVVDDEKDKNGTVLTTCSLESPVVYSRVTVQLNWIKKMMKK